MSSLLDAVHEVMRANPSASEEEVGRAIVDHISWALPDIVRSLRTPMTPSPVAIKERQFRLRRMRRGRKVPFTESMSGQDQFVKELTWMKRVLDGGSSSSLPTMTYYGDEDARFTPRFSVQRDSSFLLPTRKTDGTPSPDLSQEVWSRMHPRVRSFSPYLVSMRVEETAMPRVVFHPEVEEMISSNPVFREFFRVVESATRKFIQAFALSWEFDASIPADVEMPWWKRTILRIRPHGTAFEESLRLWDAIDATVREAIREAAAQDQERGQEMMELNKNFFIEMDLA